LTTELFDSHCHLHDARMQDLRAAAGQRAVAAGVCGLLLAGVDRADWRAQVALSAELGADASVGDRLSIARAYGIHPQVIEQYSDAELASQLDSLTRALAGRDPELPPPHAVGELGLDARTPERRAGLARQASIFAAQLALARERELPIVLHILRCHGEALRLLRRDGIPRCGGVVHSYSGSAELIRDYLALGLSISFSGAVTRVPAQRLHAAVRAVPADRLLIETDAPDQTPIEHRPTRNEPAFLPTICAAMAALRGEDPAQLAQITTDNARRLFRLPPRRTDDPRVTSTATRPTQP
jgi:TatD DNase family protein